MNPTPIDHPDDPRLELYTLSRDGVALRNHRSFIAEGRTVVELLLASPLYNARSVLVARSKLDALAPLLAGAGDTPVYTLPDELMEDVLGFDFHRGVLAAGDAGEPTPPSTLIAQDHHLLLALEGVNNHDNTGAAFRNAAAFGAGAVLLDTRTADPLYRKSIRVSMGHALRLPFARAETSRKLNEALNEAGYRVLALTPADNAVTLAEACATITPSDRVCVLVGAEGPGLSVAAQRSATTRVRIPMAPGVDSLNLAAAAAVALAGVYAALSAPSRT